MAPAPRPPPTSSRPPTTAPISSPLLADLAGGFLAVGRPRPLALPFRRGESSSSSSYRSLPPRAPAGFDVVIRSSVARPATADLAAVAVNVSWHFLQRIF